jgi:beta-N-acetylhexosaminidase
MIRIKGRKSLLILLAALTVFVAGWQLAASGAQTTKPRPFTQPLSAAEKQWVARTFAALTLEEKIGQMVAADANAVFMNREDERYQKLERQIKKSGVGCLILFRSDVWATAVLVNRLQGLAKVPLLVSADLEMGPGMRFNDTVWWTPNMAVGATGDATWAKRQGAATAREALAVGVNWLYAPVADVNNNPENPVINTRSYGEDPQLVASFVKAFITGAQDAGTLATAKHFPGHGDTATDSHIGLPVINVSRARLNEIELVPFRAAIAAGVGAIMSAHIALPQIEPEAAPPVRQLNERERNAAEFLSQTESDATRVTLPATLSPKILTGLLRQDLNFQGLAITDAMSMAGVAARYDAGGAAVQAVKAGADIVLKSPDVEAAIAAISAAVARGEIPQAQIDTSVRRILEAKARLNLHLRRTVALDDVDRIVSNPQSQQVAQEIADRSMTLVRDEKKLLPLDLKPSARVIHLTITDDEERNVLAPFIGELRQRNVAIENISFDSRSRYSESEARDLTGRLRQAELIILSLAVRARSGKGTVALPGNSQAIVREALDSGKPLIAISFGNPYLLQALPNVPAYLIAYSIFPVSQRAAARALIGEIEIQGRLPIGLPGLYPRGHGLRIARRT